MAEDGILRTWINNTVAKELCDGSIVHEIDYPLNRLFVGGVNPPPIYE